MVTIGKNILENLTTGMYSDSKVAYREYVQNACDQMDKAIEQNIISSEDALIDIYLDEENRYISIKDNATGIPVNDFKKSLGDIANSDKEQGKDKGFRGIGRLCGLAYCKTLKFTASAIDEDVTSIMICDAEEMRRMLRENKKYTIEEILSKIIKFDTRSEELDQHFFEVELIGISSENTDLLDEKKVKEYLSFIAPVPYKNTFLLRDEIYSHANEIGYKIDEYNIKVNGEQVFKEYTTKLKEQNGTSLKNYDKISRLEFKDFYAPDGSMIAWMWVGLSRFEKSIPKINAMRGLRLRQANIQIGNADSLQNLFKESRGNNYFVGEVFSVSYDLIANSQRDYFNETKTRVLFETELRRYFHDTLHKLYYGANEIKNVFKRQEEFIEKVNEFQTKMKENSFIDEQSRQKLQSEIEKAREEAEKAKKKLTKYDDVDHTSPIAEVKKRISEKFKAIELIEKVETTDIKEVIEKEPPVKKGGNYAVDTLSKLSRNERKLVSKIWSIITNNAPKEVAEDIIEKIKEEFK